MGPPRQLVVIADDFGIGPDTDRGILELAAAGTIPESQSECKIDRGREAS